MRDEYEDKRLGSGINHSWESLQVILSEPKKTSFFPYYEFQLAVGFDEKSTFYTFTGDKEILTMSFEMVGNKLRMTTSWSGFGSFS